MLLNRSAFSIMPPEEEIWKLVPIEFTFGVRNVIASNKGNVKIEEKLIRHNKGPKGKYGYYKIITLNKKTTYIHRLVFYAHSNLSNAEKLNGRVIFKNSESLIDNEGYYRSWYEDLLFEKSKVDYSKIAKEISITTGYHHKYGYVSFGSWIPLFIVDKLKKETIKTSNYMICLLNNSETPCLIKNIDRDSYIKYHFHSGHDGYVSISYNGKNTNYRLSHIMLASAFPTVSPDDTVDHINDNSYDHNILNLQWMSISENSKKGQAAQPPRMKCEEPLSLDGEIWKPLPINQYTLANYQVSNMARIKKKHSISKGSKLRGRKYRQTSIALEANKYVKYYMHQLVYLTFVGPIPENKIILHDDKAPLIEDAYRNWLCDLRIGDKTENNKEYHSAKRDNASNIDDNIVCEKAGKIDPTLSTH